MAHYLARELLSNSMNNLKGKTVSLVLGSGAARGLAHIGVIRALQRAGLRIEAVSGCSMGALIGGFYAAGKLDEYEDWVCELREFDVIKFLDISLGTKAGLLKGESIIAALRQLVGDFNIEQLDIPFTAVAVDLKASREVWLDKGDLFQAIRASIAIPAIFSPVNLNGRYLFDGGLLNPVPIAPILNNHSDLTIAVNVMGAAHNHPLGIRPVAVPEPLSKPGYRTQIESFVSSVQSRLGLEREEDEIVDEPSLMDAILESVETMQEAITRFKLAAYQPDLLVDIPINVCQAHEFYRAREIIAAGEYWAQEALDRHIDRTRGSFI